MSQSKPREEKPRLKLVVRALPPQLTAEAFEATIVKFRPSLEFFYYAQGKVTEKKSINSRAYLGFPSPEMLKDFARAFDGHIFLTNRGREQRMRVEFAPFQKVSGKTKKLKSNPLDNTISNDPDFLQFVQNIHEPVKPLVSAEEQLDKRLAEQKELDATGPGYIVTPLLEFMKSKNPKKRMVERRRKSTKTRPTAPIKEVTAIAVNPKKKDEQKGEEKKGEEKRQQNPKRTNEKKRKEGGQKEARPKKEGEEGNNVEKKKLVFAVKKSQEPGLISIETEVVNVESNPSAENGANKNPANRAPSNRRGGGGPRRGGQKYTAKQPVEAKSGP